LSSARAAFCVSVVRVVVEVVDLEGEQATISKEHVTASKFDVRFIIAFRK
jgi:hypothetical protein